MKAVMVTEFGSADSMHYTEVDMPDVKAHDVLIRVEKTSVNFADIKSRYGKKGAQIPFIPGLDAAGVIEKVGADVQALRAGQRVIAFPKHGSYAEFVLASEQLVFPIPDGLDINTAAACPTVSFLSHRLLTNIADLQQGESVLIHAAAGGVGTTAIQLAKLLGAGQVIGTVGSYDKVEIVRANGADHIINYRKEDFAAAVNELTNGQGVDVILDSVAGEITETSLECLAPYGRLVQFGNSGGRAGTIKTNDLHASCRSVLGFSLGTTRKKRPYLLKETATQIFPLLADGRLKMNIGHEFTLREAADAHRLMENRLSTGKILLNVRNGE
ncbi:quinone oxidoreductase family protein [Planococcus lenghuensis]|uniref:Quinone oxidoreductase n=1 Tax=Planococcus lenghuensis TaxID=2213202 RepID=A0A1Q2KWM9_9BACL|nr:NADPH:quinone oxidoreductase family protein [Planococcus lenghuensis]AQQ52618.1 quinone oxidoreductase [Planococcus lenghuensis]